MSSAMSARTGATTTIALRRDAALGAVLHFTLNRPELRNAMSMTMVGELRTALADAERDGITRVIVLRGAGGHFCAGADLRSMADARAALGANPNALVETNAAFGELCVAFACTGLAVVAVLEGTVMGGGFGLACVADVAIASTTVDFRLPETSLGLVPAQIGPFLVERLGYSQAKRLAVTGARINAAQALAIGLVHEVHEASANHASANHASASDASANDASSSHALDTALERVITDILRCAPQAVAATKALIAKARHVEPQALVIEAAQVFSRAALGSEGVEGTTAFLQKRPAAWVPQ